VLLRTRRPVYARRHPQPDLPRYLSEANTLNALWLKVSLGHFRDTRSDLRTLLNTSGMALVVENDQTDCGQLAPMQRFPGNGAARHADLRYGQLAVGRRLAGRGRASSGPAVSYIHVKAAVPHKDNFRAVAPDRADARWLDLLGQLPADAPRGIEFPLEGADLTAVTRHYVNLLREE
jgi:hypothetical protein